MKGDILTFLVGGKAGEGVKKAGAVAAHIFIDMGRRVFEINDLGLVVMHPENEIAVANIAIGAAYTGARAMVGSSGGGFALMQEAFSLAGMTETPLLCVLSSRPGSSTGVPTYTEQADLRFAILITPK